MLQSQSCPRCGATLGSNAPDGLCPACLIEQGFETHPGKEAGRPGHRFTPPAPEELAPLFPQLELLELIGRGGMGAVYKARQKGLDRIVALKILPPEVGRDPAFAERFTREARALARLNHPNIVAVHDVGRAGDYYFFVMEYVDGLNLRETLLAGKLKPQEAMAIVPQICDALQYAHDEGIVHRDIKPENILLDRRGRVKIADFGLAKLMGLAPTDATLTQEQQVMGTPRYMAPEQIEHSSTVDHRADIYSLGVVFYEMLTGELPLGRFAPPSKKVQIDVRLDEVVLRSLEKEPQRRFQQVREFKTSVETIAAGPQPAAAPPHPVDHRHHEPRHPWHGERRRPRHGALWAILAALLFLMMMCCLPIVVAAVVLFSYTGVQMEQPLAQPDALQPEEAVHPSDGRVGPEPPLSVPRPKWRDLEFRIVPNVGGEAKAPRLSQDEFDDLQEQAETEGVERANDPRFEWIELSSDVDAAKLPTALVNKKRYVLVSAAKENSLEAPPLRVSVVMDSEAGADQAAVEFELSAEDGDRMKKLTGANIENKLAVVASGQVISVATIREAIGGKGRITGNTLRTIAFRLLGQLRLDPSPREPDSGDSGHDHK